MTKFKQFSSRYLAVASAVVSGLVFSLAAHAQTVDPDISTAVGNLASSTKINTVGVVGANIQYVAIIFALMLGIAVIMRLTKRAAK